MTTPIVKTKNFEQNITMSGLTEPFGTFTPTLLQSLLIRLVRQNILARSAVRTRANRLLQYIRSGAIDFSLYGLMFRFFPAENSGDRKALLSPRDFDCTECRLIAKHLPKNGIFLDIGSNIGIYTFHLASIRPDIKILAFEPSPRVFAKLSYNLTLNNLGERVKAFEMALSDVVGELNFDSQQESLVLGEGNISVKTDTLINVLKRENISKIGALKIDVEGAEDKVLLPFFTSAPKTLWPEIVVIEHVFPDQWDWDCISFLKNNGYLSVWRGKMNTVYRKSF